LITQLKLKELDSLETSFTTKSDSLRKSYVQQKDKLTGLKAKYLNRIDSLKKSRTASLPGNPLDTLKSNPDINMYAKKIDSLDQRVADLEDHTMKRIDSLKSGVNRQLDKLKFP
jgi:hypothetical protein